MKKEERNGIIWTGAERLVGQALGFVQGVILARLLSPNDFGLAAMLGIFLGVGGILAESGLGKGLVALGAKARNIEELERKAFKWNFIVAVGIYALFMAISPLIAKFYREPILVSLMGAMGAAMVLTALTSVDNARLMRELRFKEISSINLGTSVLAALVGIVLALAGWGVWAIATLNVVGALAKLAALRFVVKRRSENQLIGQEDVSFARLIRSGANLVGSGVMHSVYFNSFQLIIGRIDNPAAVGLYTRAQRWSQLPGVVINSMIGRVAFASLSAKNSQDVRREGLGWLAINAAILWPALIVLGIFAEEVVGFVLGAQWLETTPYLRILLIGAAFSTITNMSRDILNVRERTARILKADIVILPLSIIAILVGLNFGIEGLCWAKVVGEAIEAGVLGYSAWK